MFGCVRRGDALDVLSSKEKHGTHVAGIIAANGDVKGVNPHARIVGVRVTLPDPGSSTGESVYTSGIVRGLGWMVETKRDYGVNIEGFNLSIAGPTGVTYAARAAFKLAEENGIVRFVAAGNFGANVDEGENLLSAVQQGSTVVVDSADTTGDTSWFSNYGKINTDVFSPGVEHPGDAAQRSFRLPSRYRQALRRGARLRRVRNGGVFRRRLRRGCGRRSDLLLFR